MFIMREKLNIIYYVDRIRAPKPQFTGLFVFNLILCSYFLPYFWHCWQSWTYHTQL